MMEKIAIALHPKLKNSEVLLGSDFIFSEQVVLEIGSLGSRFALFCDEHVAALWGQKWASHLQNRGLSAMLFTFPSGEKEKSRERKAILEDQLLLHHFGRDTCIIALGGGATLDLVGFLASTFCRGVSLAYIPTTLLAMVDAAIGGKTAVNTPFGKNMIGTFYPADKIFIDPALLSSLPSSEWTNGCAEILKYALIQSPLLFGLLQGWRPTDPLYLIQVISHCIQIKVRIVEADFEEKNGLRQILNFGHTIGHALERVENYRLPHGEAVAIGMLIESHLSLKMGLLPQETYEQIVQLIRSFPFKFHLSDGVTLEKIDAAFLFDKKAKGGIPHFVLLEKIGSCCPFAGNYTTAVPKQILEETLHSYLGEAHGTLARSP